MSSEWLGEGSKDHFSSAQLTVASHSCLTAGIHTVFPFISLRGTIARYLSQFTGKLHTTTIISHYARHYLYWSHKNQHTVHRNAHHASPLKPRKQSSRRKKWWVLSEGRLDEGVSGVNLETFWYLPLLIIMFFFIRTPDLQCYFVSRDMFAAGWTSLGVMSLAPEGMKCHSTLHAWHSFPVTSQDGQHGTTHLRWVYQLNCWHLVKHICTLVNNASFS